MKIKCIILRKDRTVKVKYVNPDDTHFEFKGGIYNLEKSAVNLSRHKNINPKPELIFIEDVPNPITKSSADPSQAFLEETLAYNFLKNVADLSLGITLKVIFDFLKSPGPIIVAVAVIIVASFFGGLLGG